MAPSLPVAAARRLTSIDGADEAASTCSVINSCPSPTAWPEIPTQHGFLFLAKSGTAALELELRSSECPRWRRIIVDPYYKAQGLLRHRESCHRTKTVLGKLAGMIGCFPRNNDDVTTPCFRLELIACLNLRARFGLIPSRSAENRQLPDNPAQALGANCSCALQVSKCMCGMGGQNAPALPNPIADTDVLRTVFMNKPV